MNRYNDLMSKFPRPNVYNLVAKREHILSRGYTTNWQNIENFMRSLRRGSQGEEFTGTQDVVIYTCAHTHTQVIVSN